MDEDFLRRELQRMSHFKMINVQQVFNCPCLTDIEMEVLNQLSSSGAGRKVKPGHKIAIAVGSRGIANITRILSSIISELKKLGAYPFIIPAMGSHGGATAEGQLEVLKSLHITEESVGAPIISSMDVVEIGRTCNGARVYVDKNAYNSDGIIVVNRIKPHTGFKAKHESGLFKMMAVGLGKHMGCIEVHKHGLWPTVYETGRVVLEKAPILCGIGIVENSRDETAVVKSFTVDTIEAGEAKLLEMAYAYLPKLPFDDVDLLIVEEIGKNISGTGMDVNVIGRMMKLGEPEPERPLIKRIIALDLTKQSHGNALGMGLADIITQKLHNKINFDATYENVISAGVLERGRMPVIAATEAHAIQIALNSLINIKPEDARVVRIKNTLELSYISISEALIEEAKSNHNLRII